MTKNRNFPFGIFFFWKIVPFWEICICLNFDDFYLNVLKYQGNCEFRAKIKIPSWEILWKIIPFWGILWEIFICLDFDGFYFNMPKYQGNCEFGPKINISHKGKFYEKNFSLGKFHGKFLFA